MSNLVFITGIPRSGSGLVADILQLAGVHIVESKNKRIGHHEHIGIHAMNGNILSDLLIDPELQAALKPTMKLPYHSLVLPIANRIRHQVNKLLKPDSINVIKSAELMPLHPFYHAAYSKAKWILVRRKKENVVQSCIDTGYMKQYLTKADWAEWYEKFKSLYEKDVTNKGCLIVYLDRGDLVEMVASILDYVGIAGNAEEIANQIKLKL